MPKYGVGQQLHYAPLQAVDVEMLRRARGEYLRGGEAFLPFVHELHQVVLPLEEVDLVDDEEHGDLLFRHAVEVFLVLFGVLDRVGYVEEYVCVGERALRESEHRLLKLVFRLEHARGVGIHDLVFRGVDDSGDAVSRGLRLRCDDREAFADEVVHQGGLSDVGVADYVDESGLVSSGRGCFSFFHGFVCFTCV